MRRIVVDVTQGAATRQIGIQELFLLHFELREQEELARGAEKLDAERAAAKAAEAFIDRAFPGVKWRFRVVHY